MSDNLAQFQELLASSMKLEKDDTNKAITLTLVNPQIKENMFVGAVIKNEETIKQFLLNFIKNGKANELDISIDDANNLIEMVSEDEDLYVSIYEFLNEFINGDYLKNFTDEMMNQFSGMFGEKFSL
jgi:hypothetical protein